MDRQQYKVQVFVRYTGETKWDLEYREVTASSMYDAEIQVTDALEKEQGVEGFHVVDAFDVTTFSTMEEILNEAW